MCPYTLNRTGMKLAEVKAKMAAYLKELGLDQWKL